ncbi:MAG: Gfo/Idh/MocA family oxidoreductase [Acidobacteriia bacterium]|nr:Gfo/Idh/MocA family oxidoreductase [Terriglobia bacterium]
MTSIDFVEHNGSYVTKPRIAVIGAGSFGKNHIRVVRESPNAELAGVLDPDPARAEAANCRIFSSLEELAGNCDAAVVASPTSTHAEIGCRLMESGLDVLVEKPIAHDPASARRLVETAGRCGKVLQVGHLERFNPAVMALEAAVSTPLFFEIHRMSEFSPRSLDVDVVLDLMIHDIDIVLSLTRQMPEEIRAAGILILSPKVDIANVRLQFPGGCIANLTASRVSTERIRKLRLFQPHEYISLDYSRQDAVRFRVTPPMKLDYSPLPVVKDEPLKRELENFFECIQTRAKPRVTGEQGTAALDVAHEILAKIEEHAHRVAAALQAGG